MEAESALLGAWRLRSWTLSDGRGTTEPFGPDATGQIMYTPDGRMSAIVAAAGRPDLPGGRPRDASDAELAAAFLTFFTYSGTWHVEGDEVVHDVELALNPNTVGTDQRRHVTFSDEGHVLELSAEEQTARGARVHRLTWERV